jgi:hypothetical protein
MKRLLPLLGIALFAAPATGVADTLAGVVYGGPTQSAVVCYLFNVGPGTVTVTAKTISEEAGEVAQYGTTCSSPLGAGKTCWFGAYITLDRAYSCRAVLSPSGDNVRGSIDIRDSTAKVLARGDMR